MSEVVLLVVASAFDPAVIVSVCVFVDFLAVSAECEYVGATTSIAPLDALSVHPGVCISCPTHGTIFADTRREVPARS